MESLLQPDTRTFAALGATDALWVGPHNIFEYRGLRLNDRSQLEAYCVEEVTGFESPDLLVGEQPSVEEDRVLPDVGFYGGRTMIMTGYISAGTYTQVARMAKALGDALVSLAESPLLITTAPGSLFTMPDVTIQCRKIDKLMIDTKVTPDSRAGFYKQGFTISLRASDPTYKGVVAHTATLIPSVIDQLGRVYPRTYDLEYTVPIDEHGVPIEGIGANTVVLHNAGNWKSFPTITFVGPMSGASLMNQVNGLTIKLSTALSEGQALSVDTTTGEILDQEGNDSGSLVDDSSDWIYLEGARASEGLTGDNPMTLSVASFSGSASVLFSWLDTSV